MSEYAGAAKQLGKDALPVDPYDVDGLANTIYQALRMGIYERTMRMSQLRKLIREQDIYWWANLFLQNIDYQASPQEELTGVDLALDGVC